MPIYPPLYMPEEPPTERSFRSWMKNALTFSPTPAEQNLLGQIKARGPIPAKVWGEHDRAELGGKIASIIAERMPWPNDHFIPDDPFGLLTYVIGYDDLVLTEIFMAVEENLGITVNEVEEELFAEWTFGQVVDYLRMDRSAIAPGQVDCRPVSLSDRSGIETRPCPTLATFVEIRRILTLFRSHEDSPRITPSTSVRALDEHTRRRLDWFVSRRYGTGATPIRPYFPLRTAVVSAVSTARASVICGGFLAIIGLFDGANLIELLAMFALGGCFVAVVGASLIGMGTLDVVARREYWRVRSRAYRSVETVGQLVEWGLAQRKSALGKT